MLQSDDESCRDRSRLSMVQHISIWAVVSCVFIFGSPAQSKCETAFIQGFNPYNEKRQYSKDDIARDFPTTKGPFKMVESGDQGSPTTVVEGQAIQAFFPKGVLVFLALCMQSAQG
jgi:hypothetical protein